MPASSEVDNLQPLCPSRPFCSELGTEEEEDAGALPFQRGFARDPRALPVGGRGPSPAHPGVSPCLRSPVADASTQPCAWVRQRAELWCWGWLRSSGAAQGSLLVADFGEATGDCQEMTMQGQDLLCAQPVAAPSCLRCAPSFPACPGSTGQSPSHTDDGAAAPGLREHITYFIQPIQLCSRGRRLLWLPLPRHLSVLDPLRNGCCSTLCHHRAVPAVRGATWLTGQLPWPWPFTVL